MIKVEAVVVREKVEEVMDAVTDRTGHVGVTVLEAAPNGGTHGSPVGPLLHVVAALADPGLPPGEARLRPTAQQTEHAGRAQA